MDDNQPSRWRWLAPVLVWSLMAVSPAGAVDGADGFAHGISLLHDLKYSADFEHFEYVNPDAPKGGTFVGYGTQDIRNFGGDWSNEIEPAVGWERTYDRLIIRSADELAGYYGYLAEGIHLSADNKRLTFRLHATAHFHDGAPITSRDVKYSFDQAISTVDGMLFLDWVESVEIIDERHVRLHLEKPLTNSNLLLLSYAPRILPYHYWKDRQDPSETTLEPPLGSGPYRFADFDKGYVRYERVEDYWGASLPVNRGRYNFDVIRYEIYRDTTVTREALRKGLLDYYVELDIRHWVRSYETPAHEQGLLRKEELYVRDSAGPASAIVFNSRRAPFSDVRVREALALAFDFEWQNRALWYGSRERAMSYFAGSRFAASGLPDSSELELLQPFRNQVPPRVFTHAYELPVTEGYGRNREALLRSRALLAQAGWYLEDGHLVDAEGRRFEFEFLLPAPDQQRIVLPYIDGLRRLGITASVRLVESAQWINLMQTFEYDAFIQGHGTSQPPIMMLPFYFHSSAAVKPLTFNKAGITDPVVDALIEHAQQAIQLDDIVASCRVIDRILLWQFYHVPMQQVEPPRLVYWDKFGRPRKEQLAKHQPAVDFIDLWWHDKDRARRVEAALNVR
jgi:microcin C transport system substrate-binding protein